MDRSCLFIGIGRSKNNWHPTIFEAEEECHPQCSWKLDGW